MPKPSNSLKHLVIQDAKFDCFKVAAQYLGQASAEGRLGDFVKAVQRVYMDRWPNDEEVDCEKVYLSLAMASISCAQDPALHWETVLNVNYDRLHRPTLRDIARRRGLERYEWPAPAQEHTSTDTRKEPEDVLKGDVHDLVTVAESSNRPSVCAGGTAGSSAEIDFFKPFNIYELMGEDAELFLQGLEKPAAVIRAS
ncbi:hypothetical protein CVT26_004951 [Gymnopilus dilepis]|uniref:Uncharacterized protein n=1 Tax=Gymnopilus dilepis TaxID=231916 RepID=A0A409Y014_9AGAR|nr:hypothetical protein CVT26_004951 [Gymnopilus dilepis]